MGVDITSTPMEELLDERATDVMDRDACAKLLALHFGGPDTEYSVEYSKDGRTMFLFNEDRVLESGATLWDMYWALYFEALAKGNTEIAQRLRGQSVAEAELNLRVPEPREVHP